MRTKQILFLLVFPILTACNVSAPQITLTPVTSTETLQATQTPTAVNTPTPTITLLPTSTATISFASINKPDLHPSALNEQNAQTQMKNLASFNGNPKSCLISSDLDHTIGIRDMDGKRQYLLAVENREAGIQIWDLESKKIVKTLKIEKQDNGSYWFPHSLLFHPNQQELLAVINDGANPSTYLSIVDMESQKIVSEFELKDSMSGPVVISPDGYHAALSPGYKLIEFDLHAHQTRDTNYDFPLYWETISPYTYASTGDLLSIVYARDEKLHLLNLSQNQDMPLEFPFTDIDEVDRAEAIISTMAINSNTTYIAGGAKNGSIYIWDAISGKLLQTIEAHEISRSDGWLGDIKMLDFSPQTNLLVSVGFDGFVKLWDGKTGALIKELNGCYFGRFTADGRYLVMMDENNIQLWGIP